MIQDNHQSRDQYLSCPLECSPEKFSLDSVKVGLGKLFHQSINTMYLTNMFQTHLVTSHGCNKSDIVTHKTRSGLTSVSVDIGDNVGDTCPRCRTRIITGHEITMESHVMLSCSARSRHVSRAVSRVTNISDPEIDPLLVLRMEMTSVVTQDAGEDDQKYLFLPNNFTQKYLRVNKIPPDSDTLELFDVWSDYVDRSSGDEDISEVIDNFEDSLESMNVKDPRPPTASVDDLKHTPDPVLLAKLKTEIISGLSPCPRDIRMRINQMGLTL